MRRFCRLPAILFLFLVSLPAAGIAETPAQSLKILTIGNSFADNALTYLPALAKATDRSVETFRANLGGSSLERHATALQAFETNPNDAKGSPYKVGGKHYSLPDALKSKPWDYVTIQQVSTYSFQPETYEPFAGQLIAAVKKYAPGAEIIVHQTWAYREDYSKYDSKTFTPDTMYKGLKSAYEKLSANYGGLRIIPSGDAFQLALANPRWHLKYPDPTFDYKHPAPGAVPKQPGALIVGWTWLPDRITGEMKFQMDYRHANTEGRYLASCVWYEFFFGDDVTKNTFVPKSIVPKDAMLLRQFAHQAVTESAASHRN